MVERTCHLCGKTKGADDEWRANYVMAFHYDRRHGGWTRQDPDEGAERPESGRVGEAQADAEPVEHTAKSAPSSADQTRAFNELVRLISATGIEADTTFMNAGQAIALALVKNCDLVLRALGGCDYGIADNDGFPQRAWGFPVETSE